MPSCCLCKCAYRSFKLSADSVNFIWLEIKYSKTFLLKMAKIYQNQVVRGAVVWWSTSLLSFYEPWRETLVNIKPYHNPFLTSFCFYWSCLLCHSDTWLKIYKETYSPGTSNQSRHMYRALFIFLKGIFSESCNKTDNLFLWACEKIVNEPQFTDVCWWRDNSKCGLAISTKNLYTLAILTCLSGINPAMTMPPS